MIKLTRSRLHEQEDGTLAMTVTLMPRDVAAFFLLSPTCDDAFFVAADNNYADVTLDAPESMRDTGLHTCDDDAAQPVNHECNPPAQGVFVGGTDSMQGLFASPRGESALHIDLGRLCHHAPFQRYVEELRPIGNDGDSLSNAIQALQSMSQHEDFLHFYAIWHAKSQNAHENPFPDEVIYVA